MKVSWWQGGLHLEPESPVESEALLVLLHSVHYERPPETDTPARPNAALSGECDGQEP